MLFHLYEVITNTFQGHCTDTEGKWQMVVYHCVGGEVARGEGGEGLMAAA